MENMEMKVMEGKFLEEAHTFLHPIRYRIVQFLAEKPMHINAISNAMGEDRRHVSYHQQTLEEYGFVKSKFEISGHPKSKGKALRIYQVTDKVAEVISELKKL